MGIIVDVKKYKQMKINWYNGHGRILFPYKKMTLTIVIIIKQLANVTLAN